LFSSPLLLFFSDRCRLSSTAVALFDATSSHTFAWPCGSFRYAQFLVPKYIFDYGNPLFSG
jgi:hypothetical protein